METGKNAIDASHVYRIVRNLFIFITCFPKGKSRHCVSLGAITKTNKRLVLFEKKPFAKLPRVKHLLSKYNQTDGVNYYQSVKLSNFKASFDSLSRKKNEFLDTVKSSIK